MTAVVPSTQAHEQTAGGTVDRGPDHQRTWTVGQVGEMMGLPTTTLRFYEKEGLLPPVDRNAGGQRRYTLTHLETLRFVECMKAAGLPLRDIREIIELSQQGDSTIGRRLEIMRTQRDAMLAQLAELREHLQALEYKTWYYETAAAAGTCAVPDAMIAAGEAVKPAALRVELD